MTEPRATDETITGPEGSTARTAGDAKLLDRGASVGRYVVLGMLGAGGMGVVYAAYDPELDRKVALKLLRVGGAGTRGSEARTRLIREARALAKLSHPNVVAVHDVGTHGADVFLAMEHVDGIPLGEWAKGRSWREIVRAIIDVGRGVAAAHAAGLLHRDLKPDNVMVGSDGRVRVMDLGLARAVAGPQSPDQTAPDVPLVEDALAASVTRAGAIVGTPAYMAPEQFLGLPTEAHADQFSLCVTAWEVLYDERPFGGETLHSLVLAITEGQLRRPPRDARVPAWLRRTLERGLNIEPERRWATVEALIGELERGQARTRLRFVLGGVVALGVTAGVIALVRVLDVRARTAACEEAGASISQVWNDDARVGLRDALIATGVSYAPTTANKVLPWLDGQASAWQVARTQACLDADVRELWDASTFERSLWCLEERRMELEALVVQLTRADGMFVLNAVNAAAGLTPVERCRNTAVLERLPLPPHERREEVREISAELSTASALGDAGKPAAGLEIARAAHERARGLEWPPLTLEASITEASLLEMQGSFEEAALLAARAYFDAARIGAWGIATDAAQDLIYMLGYRLARPTEGLAWGEHAEMAAAHAGDPEGLREGVRLNNLASVRQGAGEHEKARVLYERALAIQEAALGDDHPEVAQSLNNLAVVSYAAGDYANARVLIERALAIRETALGVDHPDVAQSLNILGAVHRATGDYAQALPVIERGLAISEKALGADHPDLAAYFNSLALVHMETGELEQALPLLERALVIKEKVLGDEHPDVAIVLNNLALVHSATGDYAQTRLLDERALAIREKAFGTAHPTFAQSLASIARTHYDIGEYAQARVKFERATAILEASLGADHPKVAETLTHLARVHLATNDPAAALLLVERALAIYDSHDGEQRDEPIARFTLARALVATGGNLARARASAEQARDRWRGGGQTKRKQLEDVERWLAEHGSG